MVLATGLIRRQINHKAVEIDRRERDMGDPVMGIDELNILNATHLAMRRAADQVGAAHARLGPCPEHRMSFGPVKCRVRQDVLS